MTIRLGTGEIAINGRPATLEEARAALDNLNASICYCNHLKTTHANDSGKCLWPGCECVCFVEGK